MVTFTKIIPEPDVTDVARTTIVVFTMLVDAFGIQISTLAVSVNGVVAISSGGFVNGFTGNIFPGTGKYVIGVYPKSPYFPAATEIPITISVMDSFGTLDSYGWSFYTAGVPEPPPPSPPSGSGRACLHGRPFFLSNNNGLQLTKDEGTGTEITLSWNVAEPYNYANLLGYNIYMSRTRENLFLTAPRFMSIGLQALIGGLPPDEEWYFGIRAAEFDVSVSDMSELPIGGTDMYIYPLDSLVGPISATATTIRVGSVDDFPDRGVIEVDYELIRYLSKQIFPPALISDVLGRGVYGTTAAVHASGTSVYLWRGNEDTNTIIVEAIPTFQKPNYALTHVASDGYGPDGYRDGYDGYSPSDGYYFPRQVQRDSITTDGSNNDASGEFPRFDYCGTYRRLPPEDFWQGQCVGTYFGGVQLRDGHRVRGNNVRFHMLQREELLLETDGEPFVLMRRFWTGIRCSCFMLRREHPDARCEICFGVGFVGGFEQFINPRRPDGRILVRVDPAVDDLKIGDKDGLTPDYKPGSWTMAFPAIKDRDVLVRFNANNTEEFRYEILDVTRVRSFFGQSGVQKFNMQRFHRTDIVYQFSVQRDLSPYGISITTGISSGPGIPVHSHGLVMPNGASISSINGTTFVNERHSHIIRKGVVLTVLGHTHSL